MLLGRGKRGRPLFSYRHLASSFPQPSLGSVAHPCRIKDNPLTPIPSLNFHVHFQSPTCQQDTQLTLRCPRPPWLPYCKASSEDRSPLLLPFPHPMMVSKPRLVNPSQLRQLTCSPFRFRRLRKHPRANSSVQCCAGSYARCDDRPVYQMVQRARAPLVVRFQG